MWQSRTNLVRLSRLQKRWKWIILWRARDVIMPGSRTLLATRCPFNTTIPRTSCGHITNKMAFLDDAPWHLIDEMAFLENAPWHLIDEMAFLEDAPWVWRPMHSRRWKDDSTNNGWKCGSLLDGMRKIKCYSAKWCLLLTVDNTQYRVVWQDLATRKTGSNTRKFG